MLYNHIQEVKEVQKS